MFTEFCDYTNREVDFKLEAENAELFAINFIKHPDIKFPKIYKEYSTSDLICMEFMRGIKPDERAYNRYNEEEREKIVDYGAYAIIQMLYHDGFFHADLHPGNLMIMDGPTLWFIFFIEKQESFTIWKICGPMLTELIFRIFNRKIKYVRRTKKE